MMTKKQQRRIAYDLRNAQADKQALSEMICARFIAQLAYQQAETVMWYVHCRSEVETLSALSNELKNTKNIVIPYCTTDSEGQNKLGLWLLNDLSELSAGTWGILEPPKSRWGETGKEITVQQLDLIMVPGVAFDNQGGRLGNGAGYYDRLLQQVRTDAVLSAVCFESQICQQVMMEKHDVYMDAVITEKNCYITGKNGFKASQV